MGSICNYRTTHDTSETFHLRCGAFRDVQVKVGLFQEFIINLDRSSIQLGKDTLKKFTKGCKQ